MISSSSSHFRSSPHGVSCWAGIQPFLLCVSVQNQLCISSMCSWATMPSSPWKWVQRGSEMSGGFPREFRAQTSPAALAPQAPRPQWLPLCVVLHSRKQSVNYCVWSLVLWLDIRNWNVFFLLLLFLGSLQIRLTSIPTNGCWWILTALPCGEFPHWLDVNDPTPTELDKSGFLGKKPGRGGCRHRGSALLGFLLNRG